jgi:tetracycline resistance efflux pump
LKGNHFFCFRVSFFSSLLIFAKTKQKFSKIFTMEQLLIDFGALCLIPPFIVIIIAMLTKRAIEPLIIGSFFGYCIVSYKHNHAGGNAEPIDAFTLFTDAITRALKDDSMVWIILVCGMYGAVIELLVRSGATMAFGNFITQYIKTKKQALLATWAVGGLMFLDDYMSALSVGNTMKNVTDRFGISRASLAYLVNTMSPPLCIIVPLSTWSIYIGKLIAKEMQQPETAWFDAYWNVIPFTFYGWAAVIVALFFALQWLPMTKSITDTTADTAETTAKEDISINPKARFYDFFIPLFAIVAATIFLSKEIDALKGIYIGLLFSIAYFWLRRLMTYDQIFVSGFEGFKSMLFALAILTFTYVLKDVGDRMGLTTYVIDSLRPIVSKAYLPVLVFLALSFISFTTASSWGLYLVAIPIVVPLANQLGANVWLCLGALVSCGGFGSNASLYSDCTVLTSNSCNINSVRHSTTQMPYALAALLLAAILFLVAGHIF